ETVPSWLSAWNMQIRESELQIGSQINPLIYASVVIGWFGAAGILVLALTALIAVTTVLLSARRSEIPVLRALGINARNQARIRLREMQLVTVLALVFGVAIGFFAAWLTVPEMAASTILNRPDGLIASLEFDYLTAAAFFGALILGLSVILWRYARVTKKQALDTEYREETR
ncbi:MAG: FtsX-like permease family protein, partial [Microbacteriaceae bacterium]